MFSQNNKKNKSANRRQLPKASAKTPAKAHKNASAKPQPKKLDATKAPTPATLKFDARKAYEPTPAEEEFEQLSFALANNDIKVLRHTSAQVSSILDKAFITKLYSSDFSAYVPQPVFLTHEDIMKFAQDVSRNIVLTPNMIGALENIAYRIGSSMFRFKPNELHLLLKVLARVEPFTIPLLSCFDMGIYQLTSDVDLNTLSPSEIIDLAYNATKIARPITGNIRVALEKLVNFMMVKIDVNKIAELHLLPRAIKILHFMEKCQENFIIDSAFKSKIIEKVKKLLGNSKPESSHPHQIFSQRLRKFLTEKGVRVEDEFLCEYVGTHLDIAIPKFKIAIEINGSTHYNADCVTENPETKLKRELLEAFGWSVVPVLVEDLVCNETEALDLRIIDDIILSEIMPLINENKAKIQSSLAAEANRNFFLCRKAGHHEFTQCRTAKEYLKTIDKVEDPREAERRTEAREQEMLVQKPKVSLELDDGTSLELDLDNVPSKDVNLAIKAFFAIGTNEGAHGLTALDADHGLNIETVSMMSQSPFVLLNFKALTDAGGFVRKVAKPTTIDRGFGKYP
jgi:hypothetical protein